ncbi:MAG TPA: DUF3375 domain-containing protein [Ktedonobacteraceae bacterium]|nr:DUF3375 domain-containing protein [Ktedonobacteraceae bacterium]
MPFRMDEDRLAWDLQYAPSIKLLKADHAAIIIGFLHHQFKYTQRVAVPLPELLEQLGDYLESQNEHDPGRYARTPQAYITEWADQEHQFLRIVAPVNSDVPMVELTADTERAIGWLEDMQMRHFVGTESRFLLIVQMLHDIVQNSIADPEERLKQLEQQRAELDRQIDQIYETAQVNTLYTSTQLRERFFEASSMARQLLRDFRLVEERFRGIARDLQKAQSQPGARKGALVEYVLDADAQLKDSDQGRSFYSFWEFLLSPSQSDELKSLLAQVADLPELRSALSEDYLLMRLPSYLVTAGEKVVQSNARLAEQLRRLLDEQIQAENRRVQELIQEIKHAAYRLNLTIPANTALLELEGAPEIQLVMERTFWEPPKTPTFDKQPGSIHEEDLEDLDLASLYDQFSINEEELERHIETLLESQPQIRLSEVLEQYPVEKGLAEVLAYCALAARDPRHFIDPDISEEIVFASLTEATPETVLRIPRIYYRRKTYAS